MSKYKWGPTRCADSDRINSTPSIPLVPSGWRVRQITRRREFEAPFGFPIGKPRLQFASRPLLYGGILGLRTYDLRPVATFRDAPDISAAFPTAIRSLKRQISPDVFADDIVWGGP